MAFEAPTGDEWIRTDADAQAVDEGCWFDLAAAERVRTFFRKYLVHSKGQWAGQPFELMEWQWRDLVAPLFGWKRADGTRRYRRAYIEVPKKNGKLLALDTPIPTPDGWRTMGDLRVGDRVFDRDGAPCRVVAVSEVVSDEQPYRLEFSDGTSVVAGERHQWITESDQGRGVRTTPEIAGHRIRMPPTAPAEFVTVERLEPVPFQPLKCIQVDSPSHTYLCGAGAIPTHNSTLFSGLSLYLLIADGEPGSEVYSAAVDRDQASIVFNEAANMVEASGHLSSRLNVVRSTKRIVHHKSKSFYKALSADVPAKEGLNAHAVLIDELHAQKSREMWDTLRYAGASRRQPLHLSITTAGFDRHSICWEQHDYAEKVLAGIIEDPAFFAYIVAAEPEDDWTDPEVWRAANPGFGVTINAEQFAEDCKEAQESPAKENSFRRYRLNQWTEQDVRWLQMEKWDACDGDVDDLDGKPCFGGLDLSATTDISALVLVFPVDDGFKVLAFFWVPEEGAHRRERKDRVPYVRWAKQGLIEMTPGEVIDYDVVRRRINELGERFDIREIAIDRWNATQLAGQLEQDGFEIVAFGQGYSSMNFPTKKLEEIVLGETLAHGGHPVLRWMASNVSIETDAAGNWKPSKRKSTERIDGIVGLIMGLARAATQPVEEENYWTPEMGVTL